MITRLSGGHGEVLIYAGIASARSRHYIALVSPRGSIERFDPGTSAVTGNKAENTSTLLLGFLSTLSIVRTKYLVLEQ